MDNPTNSLKRKVTVSAGKQPPASGAIQDREALSMPADMAATPSIAQTPDDTSDTMSIEFQLPNKKIVMMERPRIATHLSVLRICKDNKEFEQYCRALMYVSKVDDEPIIMPQSMPELAVLMNKLGDEGVDVVVVKWAKEFMAQSADDIPLIKKNVRG